MTTRNDVAATAKYLLASVRQYLMPQAHPAPVASPIVRAAQLLEREQQRGLPYFWHGLRCDGEPIPGARIAQHLEAAARILEHDGWVQHRWHHPRKGHSLGGALGKALDEGHGNGDTHYAARKCLELLLRSRSADAAPVAYEVWNDARHRTVDEVRVLLYEAVELARQYGPR